MVFLKVEKKKTMIEFMTRLLEEDPLGFAGLMVLICLAIGCMVLVALALGKREAREDVFEEG